MLPMVLVADPDPLTRKSLVRRSEPSFRCIETASLGESIVALQVEHPVLLALELDQSDGDGLLLIRQVHTHPTYLPVLIACVTWRSTVKDLLLAFQAGADDYLVKPLKAVMNFYGRMLMLRRTGQMAHLAQEDGGSSFRRCTAPAATHGG